jgi:hypothetical protein
MKFRYDFVTNSSTCSYTVLGVRFQVKDCENKYGYPSHEEVGLMTCGSEEVLWHEVYELAEANGAELTEDGDLINKEDWLDTWFECTFYDGDMRFLAGPEDDLKRGEFVLGYEIASASSDGDSSTTHLTFEQLTKLAQEMQNEYDKEPEIIAGMQSC